MVVAGAVALSLIQVGVPEASAASPVVAAPVAAVAPAVAPKAKVAAAPRAAVAADKGPLVAADVRSARVSARTQGKRVEAKSERSARSTTWANPNGTLTSDESTGPVRVLKDDGWVPLDMDLVEVAGGWAPKASPSTVTFSPGGTGPAVKLEDGSKNVRMDWVDTLPAPVIKGARATYALDATTDLVLTAMPNGFEQLLVLKAPPTTAPKLHLPLGLTGLSLRDAKDGNGWQFVDAKDEVVFESPKPLMWDAQRDEAGDPLERKIVATDLVDTADGPQLDLSPAMSWLSAPTTVYPVTIDPTIASVTRAGDTWVHEEDSTNYGSDYHLGVGNTGYEKMRGLLKFTDDQAYVGKQITAASLTLYQHVAFLCTSSPTYAYPVSSSFASSTVNWATQPTINSSAAYDASSTFSYGLEPGCPNNYGSLNVKDMVTAWASGALPNYGIELQGKEAIADAASRKYFCAMNLDAGETTACTSTSRYPTLSVTYNTAPDTAGTPTQTPGTSSATGTAGRTTTMTPTLRASVTDPDGDDLKALFSVYLQGSSTPLIDKMAGSIVTSGSVSTLVVPAGNLAIGNTYVVRAYGNDGTLTSAAQSAGYDRFTVDPSGSSGSRAAAQPLTHALSDSTSMSLNPTDGNLALSGSLLHLRGVGQDLNIGWRYNGLNDTRPTLNTGLNENALQPWTDGSFTYVAPDGGNYHFTPKNGSSWPVAADNNPPPAGINATLFSPIAGTMKLRFNPSGIVNTYVKTNNVYQLTSSADKNTTTPNTISYSYPSGKLTSITDTQGRVVTFAYTDATNPTQPTSITDTSLPRTIALVYGGTGGALSSITDATGAMTTLGYNATGLISLTNNAHQSSFGYDTAHRLTSWTFGVGSPAASTWAAAYTSSTSTTITDGNLHTATYTIAGSTTTHVVDQTGIDVASGWDGHDNLTSRTDAMSNTTTSTYQTGTNINNLLTDIISPAGTIGGTGTTSQLTYPGAPTGTLGDFQPTGTKDAQKNTSGFAYDTGFTNQAKSVNYKDSDGVAIGGTKTSTFQGDSAGTDCTAQKGEVCTTTNGNGNVTTYAYTAGNPTKITPPTPLGVRDFTYDPAGRVLSATDGRGNSTYYTYDANDRTTQVAHTPTGCPAATCVSYTYDGAGSLTSRTSPAGLTSIGYDAMNRPTTKTQAGTLISTATYDNASNLTSYTDSAGTIGYGYNTANRLVSLSEPGGSCPTPVITPNATACTGFSYDFPGRKTATSFPNGQKTTRVYDTAGRVASITARKADGTTILASRGYTYQKVTSPLIDQALLATMTDQAATTTTYGYDGLNRLTSAAQPGTTSGWAYDNDGNRTSATKTGAATVYSAYNGADQLCWTSTTSGSNCASPPGGATSHAYDLTGNQTSDQVGAGPELANTFNVFNQLTDTTIGGSTTLTSTYANTSNTERLSAGATSFLNGTLGVTSQTTSGATISYIRDPYGNLVAMRTGGQSYYYTTDQQGSVIALTDSTQALAATYTYDPWGNTTSTGSLAATNSWTYATGYEDAATGYLKLGARYYNPTTGRFTQPDPAALYGNYVYADDNPANYTDPTGLYNIKDWAGTVGTFAGGGAGVGAVVGCVATLPAACFGGGGAALGAEIGGVLGGTFGIGYATVEWIKS